MSGQFFVEVIPPAVRAVAVPDLETNQNYLKLQPSLAAISCERIKRALAEALEDKSQWRDKIYLVAYPAQSADDGATIVAERFRDGWNYRLEVPNPIERERYVRAVVQTLLQELAGRNASDHTPEIPAWLAEGLTQHLLMSNEGDLLPPPPRWSVNGLIINPVVSNNRRRDPLANARRTLRGKAPLTLAELSWPTDAQSGGSGREAYSSSAQLFVTELMRLEDGRACLRAMIDGLTQCYNWQTSFLRAFHGHFKRQLDLEKWWALQVVYFTGRDFTQTWSPEESWNKLDEILRTSVEVRHAPGELPGRAEVSLAAIIREWDFVRQGRALRGTLRELNLVRLRVSQDLVALVDDYRRVLSLYLERRDRAGLILPGSKIPLYGANNVVRETLKQLDALEAQREQLRPRPVPLSSAISNASWPTGP